MRQHAARKDNRASDLTATLTVWSHFAFRVSRLQQRGLTHVLQRVLVFCPARCPGSSCRPIFWLCSFAAAGIEPRRRSCRQRRDGERRSLLACETDLGICDKSLLTPSEIDKVAGIENERNQLNCETGAN